MPISQLKNGLKSSLISAINDYKKVLKKIDALKEKIQFYEMKMFSIGGPTYGTDVRGVRDPYDNKLIYWIDKIEEVKQEIKVLKKTKNFKIILRFISSLEPFTKKIFRLNMIERKTLEETAKELDSTPNKISKIKYKMFDDWGNFKK